MNHPTRSSETHAVGIVQTTLRATGERPRAALPIGRRVSCSLLMLCLMLGAACRRQEGVATVPTETEAIEIVNALNQRGIEAEKEEVGEEGSRQWRVTITEERLGSGKLALALQVLQENGLPRPNDKGLEGAYEEKGMFPSESAQQAQRLKELKTEIERQLRLLPTVVRVSVNIVLPEEDTINLNPYPATASVLVVYHDEKPSFTASHVQDLVARGVPKLKPENVSVVLIHESPRSPIQSPVSTRRQMTTIYTIGGGLVVLLTLLLLIFMLQARRQSRRAAARLRDDQEVAAASGVTAQLPSAAPPTLTETGPPLRGVNRTEESAAARPTVVQAPSRMGAGATAAEPPRP